jgi:hypothetical protein
MTIHYKYTMNTIYNFKIGICIEICPKQIFIVRLYRDLADKGQYIPIQK